MPQEGKQTEEISELMAECFQGLYHTIQRSKVLRKHTE